MSKTVKITLAALGLLACVYVLTIEATREYELMLIQGECTVEPVSGGTMFFCKEAEYSRVKPLVRM